MKQQIINIGLVLLLLTTGINSNGQKKVNDLRNYFTKLAENGQFNGNVLVAEKGKIIYEKSFGYADYSIKKPNTSSTSFAIASITKTFTSTAILQLQEKGKLNITDPYVKFFPDFPYPTITIKQLLSHTSRIPNNTFYGFLDSLRKIKDTIFTNADVIPVLIAMKKPLVIAPNKAGDGPTFAYSNLNYFLLALLIEKLSGMPYNSYLKKYIFLPAGMVSSSLSEFYFGIDENLCKEHRYRYLYSDPERIDTISDYAYIFKMYNFKGHGDVVSTIHDLLKYDEALHKGILLKQTTLMEAYQPITPAYGLGWMILYDTIKGKIVGHHGGGIGIEAMFLRSIEKDQTVILFNNVKDPAFDKAMNALKILNSEKVASPKKSIAKLYGKTMVKQGIPAARKLLENIKKDTLNYYLNVDEMNLLGYQFLWNNKDSFSHEVLKANLDFFPSNWNSYDSYGEILLKMGKKEEAIQMYRKSIELNPKNEAGKKILEQILGSKND